MSSSDPQASQEESQSQSQQGSGGSLLQQTLMQQDECFVYKVPPLATASGYRANDWNLAQPLQTCGFQVERRDNDLFLLFTLENHTKLFCLTKVEDGEHIQRSVEPVLDSSRYFVTKITTPKSMLIGFGFRDRDVAIDLLGNLQQFQKSIQRELQAKHMKVASISTLKEGEKMHITIPGGGGAKKSSPTRKKKATVGGGGTGGGGPFLLKKPPPSADAKDSVEAAPTQDSQTSLEVDHVPPIQDVHHTPDEDGDTDDSSAAVAKSIINDFDDIQLGEGTTEEKEVDHVPKMEDVHTTPSEDGDTDDSSAAVAKEIINDFDDELVDGEMLGATEQADDTVAAKPASTNTGSDDDDGFGDFQGA